MNDDVYMFNGINFPVKVTEGAVSIKRSASVRGDKLEPLLANPVAQGDAVVIVGFTDDGYLLVEFADGTNGVPIGFVDSHPEYDYDPTQDYTKTQAVTAGVLRKCGVESTFADIRPVTAKAGEGIKAGDYVTWGEDGQSFEKSTDPTNIIALSDQNSENKLNIGLK